MNHVQALGHDAIDAYCTRACHATLAGIESIAMTDWRHLPLQEGEAMSD